MLTVDGLVQGIPKLASYAGVLHELDEVLNNVESTLTDVTIVIEKDPALTARLLKLGNSCFFEFSSRVETVFETLSLIGTQQVRDLIATSAVIKMFDGVSVSQVSMESFWKHSLSCGVAARILAIARRLPKPERYFTAGLLHDIGRLVLFSRLPDKAREIFRLYEGRRMLLTEAEKQVLGFDHTEIGAGLLQAWNYPANLISAVRYHHMAMAPNTFQIEACLIHVADHLINAMQLGGSGEHWVPPLDMRAWDRLSLATDLLESIVKSIDDQILAVEQVFLTQRTGRG